MTDNKWVKKGLEVDKDLLSSPLEFDALALLLIDILPLVSNGTSQEDLLMAIVKNELMSMVPVIIVITIPSVVFLPRFDKTRLFSDNRFNNNYMKKNFK
ncbi:MAG: hypothetical protein WAM14_22990 [Candidatus Nitrosopolaris sp.]